MQVQGLLRQRSGSGKVLEPVNCLGEQPESVAVIGMGLEVRSKKGSSSHQIARVAEANRLGPRILDAQRLGPQRIRQRCDAGRCGKTNEGDYANPQHTVIQRESIGDEAVRVGERNEGAE